MKKVVIIGGSGAGKSTLAQTLGKKLELPIYHLDAIHWQPGWVPLSREQFIKETEKVLERDTWIIDGNYGSTMEQRLQQADTVIFLHYSTIRCLYGITKRRIAYRNKTRPDMGKDCPEKLDWEFFQWVLKFNRTKTPAIYERLSTLRDTDIHIFKNRKELQKYIQTLPDA
ncbi:AAA family ATPase [Virgibacillus indicus]|uniref:AAA family ATPase n=1 Tax=Virgibacillus indicus TaxID=2024554 RepID=A0A265N769_9BACI|nr:DNA topology modulation protein [Virgibacillus indicus]OZU87858.1 AAA family ATPase [Virgibacillus indicus]